MNHWNNNNVTESKYLFHKNLKHRTELKVYILKCLYILLTSTARFFIVPSS